MVAISTLQTAQKLSFITLFNNYSKFLKSFTCLSTSEKLHGYNYCSKKEKNSWATFYHRVTMVLRWITLINTPQQLHDITWPSV